MRIFRSAIILTLTVLMLAAILGGCSLFGEDSESESTTEAFSEQSETEAETVFLFTNPPEESTEQQTEALTTTGTTAPTTVQPPKTVTTTKKATTSTTPTTVTTTVTTTAKPSKKSDNLSSVMSKLNSGNYTMSVVITDDEEDKVTKMVSGSNRVYILTIPSANYTIKVIRTGDKYYMITSSKYCEMTKAQYTSLSGKFEKCFGYNFGGLSFQSSSVELYNSALYTRETFLTSGGSTTYLWFKDGSLRYIEDNAGTDSASKVGVSVSGGADSSLFGEPTGLQVSTYDELYSAVSLAEMFLG